MKVKFLILFISIFSIEVSAQKNVLGILNGNFELGTVQLWRSIEVRDGSYLYLGVDDALSTVNVSDDAHSGNYAAEYTWEIDDDMVDLVFDIQPMVMAETNYTFKAWAKSLDGPCMLRMHCTYFSGGTPVVVGDHFDQSWILSDVYEEHVWEVPPAPKGVLYATIGFRVFNANGSRWPSAAITTLIDDVSMWRDSHETDGIEYELNTSVIGEGGGTVQLFPASGIYCEGTSVKAKFIPYNACSQFTGWSGDRTGTEQTVDIIMDGNKSIIAETELTRGIDYELTTSFKGGGTGSIELYPEGGVYCDGTQVSATVIPDEDSQFVVWSGDASGNKKKVSVTMDGDKSIVAEIDIIEGIEEINLQSSNFASYPNPSKSSTTLTYTVNSYSKVSLSIYNNMGSLINVLVNRNQDPGNYSVNWDGYSSAGVKLHEGMYFGTLDISNCKSQNIKIVLIK